jgi:nucleoporin GLE1
LDVGGVEAKSAFGGQWEKMLGLLYQGATEGIRRTDGSETRMLIGGNSAEGKAARVRMMLEIERIIKAP